MSQRCANSMNQGASDSHASELTTGHSHFEKGGALKCRPNMPSRDVKFTQKILLETLLETEAASSISALRSWKGIVFNRLSSYRRQGTYDMSHICHICHAKGPDSCSCTSFNCGQLSQSAVCSCSQGGRPSYGTGGARLAVLSKLWVD